MCISFVQAAGNTRCILRKYQPCKMWCCPSAVSKAPSVECRQGKAEKRHKEKQQKKSCFKELLLMYSTLRNKQVVIMMKSFASCSAWHSLICIDGFELLFSIATLMSKYAARVGHLNVILLNLPVSLSYSDHVLLSEAASTQVHK